MELWNILLILFMHTVADFVFQTDEVAKGKSSDNAILAKHILVYSWIMVIPAGILAVGLPRVDLSAFSLWIAVNAILHFGTDYVTSRMTTHLWKKGDRHNFFVVIGFDQFAHAAALLTTYQWLLT